jgi:hypothetical protein
MAQARVKVLQKNLVQIKEEKFVKKARAAPQVLFLLQTAKTAAWLVAKKL